MVTQSPILHDSNGCAVLPLIARRARSGTESRNTLHLHIWSRSDDMLSTQSNYHCSASPRLPPLTNPPSEIRKCLHTLKCHFFLSLTHGSEIVKGIFMSVIHQGCYVLYNRAAKFDCGYYNSYTEEMCN